MQTVQRLTAALLTLALCSSANVARACAVCFSANDQNRMAFILTTLFMTLFPLALIGTMIWFVRGKLRDADEAANAAAAPAGDEPGPG